MSSLITPVSYRRLLTTISQDLRIDQKQKSISNLQTGKMKDIQAPVVDLESYLILEHSNDYSSSKTNFLDLLDDETLLQLAYEFGLDKKSDLPELQDIEITIGNCESGVEGVWCATMNESEKMVQRTKLEPAVNFVRNYPRYRPPSWWPVTKVSWLPEVYRIPRGTLNSNLWL